MRVCNLPHEVADLVKEIADLFTFIGGDDVYMFTSSLIGQERSRDNFSASDRLIDTALRRNYKVPAQLMSDH